MREHFHTERYIFPVRYEVIRYVSGFLYLERFFLVAAVFQSCSFTDMSFNPVHRHYLSTVNANTEVVYHCMILDGGDGPKFQIVPSCT